MLRASCQMRRVETVTRAGLSAPRAGPCAALLTACTGHVKPGTNMLGGKGTLALAIRRQRSTLLPPANATPAEDDHGGGQPGPAAQKRGPVWVFDRAMITLVVLYALLGIYPILIGQYFLAALWITFIVTTPLVLPVLLWWNQSDH